MKQILFILLFTIASSSSNNLLPKNKTFDFNQYCSRSISENNKQLNPNLFFNSPAGKPIIHNNHDNQSRPDYTIEYLNTLSYSELIDLLVSIEWSDIDGLWDYRDGTYAFFIDSDRVLSLMDAIEERGESYTADDDYGIPTLVEVTRAGFYHAFYHSNDLGYLSEDSFKENLIPSMLSIGNNSYFGFGTTEYPLNINIAHAYGAYISIGYANVDILNRTSQLFDDFYNNYNDWVDQSDYTNAVYWIGEGVRYTLYRQDYSFSGNVMNSEYFNQIYPVFESISSLSLIWDLDFDKEWLFENFTYWTGYSGIFIDSDEPVDVLTQIIELYGEWTLPTVWAYYMLDWKYGSIDYYGNMFNLDNIYDELEAWLLPYSYHFDGDSFNFLVGQNVTIEKVNLLYWASKEVKSQFHRLVLRDNPQEIGNTDDVLNVIIYNSPREYKFNNFLYNLSTNNGGIYIESWGTFFTYERTPQESIYTLEELFRHEYVHYLQGRYLVPGLWGQHPIYDNERLTWFEEGQAEFLSGSSRLEGVLPRRSIVGSISDNPAEWMNLEEILSATYSSGFNFYKYSFAFWDFIRNENLDLMFDFNEAVINGNADGFDAVVETVVSNPGLNEQYHEHINYLKDEYNELINPSTSSLYLYDYENLTDSEILEDLTNIIDWQDVTIENTASEYHEQIMLSGYLLDYDFSGNYSDDYISLDSFINLQLSSLTDYGWLGYLTSNAYFTLDNNNEYKINILLKRDNEQNSWGYSNPGCGDPLACNYEEYITDDDGSCEYPQESWAGVSCNFILIPNEYITIQDGINASVEGDSILVSAGIYYENISFYGKNISVIGENRETTIIDGEEADVVVSFINGEDNSSKLQGFTIMNGYSNDGYGGGGIKCFGSSPILENLIIKDNYSYRGAGVGCSNGGSPIIRNTLITGNTSTESGGGIFISNGSSPTIVNVTITNNTSSSGILFLSASTAHLINVIVWGNLSPNSIRLWANSEIEIRYSDINNINLSGNDSSEEWDFGGNIFIDPLFNDSVNNDFTLQEGSPCIDAAISDLNGDGYEDIIDYYGIAPDMGAYEWYPDLLGDINADGIVNVLDVVLIVAIILDNDSENNPQADLNEDGIVNVIDIVALVNIILN